MKKSMLALFVALVAVPTLAVLPKGFVGRDTCVTCHEETVQAFLAGPHGRAMAERGCTINHLEFTGPLVDASCETCHGPGEAHANDPSTANIRTNSGSSREASQGCRSCHPGQHAFLAFRTPAHERAGITCLDCHASGHTAPAGEPLLRRSRADVCTPCHAGVAAQFHLPSAHRDGQRPFECMNCHTLHGGATVRGHFEEAGAARCVTCHTELGGPKVYTHPPLEHNGCVSCHRPHGSPNPKMLTRASVTQLCLECHTNTPSFHDLSRPKYRQCQQCHSAVHGSQRSAKLFQE